MTNEKEAIKALQRKITKSQEERINYNLAHYKELGATPDTLLGLLRIFFGGWRGLLEPNEDYKDNLSHYQADFDCCYGWETVMMDAGSTLASYLTNNSTIVIYPDSGVDKMTVSNGIPRWV